MVEKKKEEKEEEKVCDWCRGGSILDIGSGCFRDLDSDFSYGIPVCGGCGGLGKLILNSKDFEERRNKIMKLRFEYCPTGAESPPEIIKLKKLSELIREVTELFKIYGREGEQSFAEEIANGCLDEEHSRLLIKVISEKPWFKKTEKEIQNAILNSNEESLPLLIKLLSYIPENKKDREIEKVKSWNPPVSAIVEVWDDYYWKTVGQLIEEEVSIK